MILKKTDGVGEMYQII